jgi:hypothetical protein
MFMSRFRTEHLSEILIVSSVRFLKTGGAIARFLPFTGSVGWRRVLSVDFPASPDEVIERTIKIS